jgi:hypothetical protein
MLNNSLGNAIASRAADDRQGGARTLGQLNGSKRIRDSVGANDKFDYYSFSVSGRSSFNLKLDKLKSNVDVALIQGGKTLGRSAKGGKKPEALNATLEEGTYYLRVNQKQGNSRYRLTLSATPDGTGNNPHSNNPPGSRARKLVSFYASGGSLNSRLGLLDTSTGDLTRLPLGNMQGTVIYDIASFGNETYAIANPNNLYKIDPATGTYTLLKNLDLSIASSSLDSMSYAPSGALYVAGDAGDVYTLDVASGKLTFLSKTPGFSATGDMVYDPTSGRFLATSFDKKNRGNDSLYSIGLSGDTQFIGNIGLRAVTGLLLDNGVLYAYKAEEGGLSQYVLNQTTGAATFDKKVTEQGQIINEAIGGSD